MRISIPLALLAASTFAACGPSARDHGDDDIVADDTGDDGDDTTTPDASTCVPTSTTEIDCDDGFDEDCDTFQDCDDIDCLNHTQEGCPSSNCGELTHPEATPLALPDGVSGEIEDAIPYETSIEIVGFASGQTMNALSDVLGVCLTIEHSYLRDIQIEADAPSGETITLSQQLGNTGGEVYLGEANDSDSADMPVPGVGFEYCWTPTATNLPIIPFCNAADALGSPLDILPAGDYQASSGFEPWLGATLNGNWTIRVYDLWGADNGFIFDWSVKFNPDIVEDCESWPQE